MILAKFVASFGGLALIVAGVGMIYRPAGLIVAGLFSLAWFWNISRNKA